MASMKPIKPSYSYDSSQSSYSTNTYDRNFNKSGHNYQAQNSPLGRPMHNFHDTLYSQTRATGPTKHYAQAQCAQPSEAIHVVQGNHVVETIKKQESLKSEEWTTGSLKCSSPSQVTHSESTIRKEEIVVEKVDQSCANKPNQYSDTAPEKQFGIGMHKEEHMVEKLEQDWANKPTQYSATSELNKCDDELGWATKPTHYSSEPQSNQYGGALRSEELMMAKAEQGWANKPSHYAIPTQSNQYGGAMHSEKLMMAKAGQGWSNKPSQYAGATQSNVYGHSEGNIIGKGATQYLEATQSNQYIMKGNEHMVGNKEQAWASKPNHYPETTQGNQYGLTMQEEEDMLEKIGNDSANNVYANASRVQGNVSLQSIYNEQVGGSMNGRITRPNKNYGPNPTNHSLQTEYNQHENHGWPQKPGKTLSPVRTGHTGLGEYNEVHMMRGMGHDLADSTSHTGLGKYNEIHMMGGTGHDWADSNTKFSRPIQPNYSGLGMYKDEHNMGKIDHVVANSPGLFSSPNNHNQYGQSMYNEQESEAYDHYGGNNVDGVWDNKQSKYLGHKQHGAYSTHNLYNEDAWAGKAGHGYSATQANRSTNGACNYEDHEDYEENVHDIMDEILTRYPAHNVSGGHVNGCEAKSGMYMNQIQVGGYAKQASYAAPAMYGSSAHSSGYMPRVKEEYSSHTLSSSSKKFEVKGMTNNGGSFDDEFW